MTKRLFWFVALIPFLMASTCKHNAKEEFDKKEFGKAAESYAKIYNDKKSTKPEKLKAAIGAAESYKNASKYKQALAWYKKASADKKADAEVMLMYAKMLKATDQWAEAIGVLQEMKTRYAGQLTEKVDCEITGAENALKWKKLKTRYIVQNEKKLNTKYNDFAPVYGPNAIYITSDRPNPKGKKGYEWSGSDASHNGYYDLYISRIDKKKAKTQTNPYASELLGKPQPVEDVYTPFNEGTIALSAKGDVMYITQCGGEKGKGINCKIYKLNKKATGWDPINYEDPVEFCDDTIHVWGQPSLSADGNKLYFASNMDGTLGGQDIWVCNFVKKGKKWSNPINLGPTINTDKDDMYPWVHPDGTLYFSSKGHCGIGGLDIFSSKGDGVSWSEPDNLRQPLNSGGDDFAFICSNTKENGFFSSNRANLKEDDIYSFSMTPLVFTLTVRTFDKNSREILPNTFVPLTNSYDTVVDRLVTDNSGAVKRTIKANTDYYMVGKKKYYFDSRNEMATTKGLEVSKDLVVDLYLEKQDTPRVLNILYDLDKANIREDAKPKLDSVVLVLNNFPEIAIELGSHTDCRNTYKYNCDLSRRRADSAVAYLVSKGIDPDRLIARGYGEFRLINDCACEPSNIAPGCDDAMHQANRRTTTRIITLDWKKGMKLDFDCHTDSCEPCRKLLGIPDEAPAPQPDTTQRSPSPGPNNNNTPEDQNMNKGTNKTPGVDPNRRNPADSTRRRPR